MGAVNFSPKTLCDSISETVGYKSGIALSVEAMCDLLIDSNYADIITNSEVYGARLRIEEYEDLFYKLLHRVGYTEEEYNGDSMGITLYHKYKGTGLEKVQEGVLEIFVETWPKIMDDALAKGAKSLDPSLFMTIATLTYGEKGLNIAIEMLELMDKISKLNPHSGFRYTEWENIEELETLFKGSTNKPEVGKFIDQRYINYLYANHGQLELIHWRKFEELTAEYFDREGYFVELGPGSNDDGVDIRVWKNQENEKNKLPPHMIIQCKRQKKKIEKIIVKGLHADMQFQDAKYGLIVTSSELSPGARNTISARGYSIEEVNNIKLRTWLDTLHQPGTGIIRC